VEGSEPTLMEQFEILEQKKKLLQRLKKGERVKDPSQALVAQAAAASLKGDGRRKKKDKQTGVELFPERNEMGAAGGAGGRAGRAARRKEVDGVAEGLPAVSPVKKEVSWEGYGLESVWKGEEDKTVETIWGQVMHRSHDIASQVGLHTYLSTQTQTLTHSYTRMQKKVIQRTFFGGLFCASTAWSERPHLIC